MRILVLGDSSSSGIGAGQAVYPFKLYLKLKDRCRVRLENHAVPGFTTSDASRYYPKLSQQKWDYVVLYLGNNEGSRSRHHKGVYRARWNLDFWRLRRQKPKPLHKIHDRQQFVFQEADADGAEVANTPQECRQNLLTIADRAVRCRSRLIVINPIANSFFPSGLGSPRAPFYRILGLPSRIGDRLIAVDEQTSALVRGIQLHDHGELGLAEQHYRSLASSRPAVSSVARNNLAVLLAERKEHEQSIAALKSLISEDRSSVAFAAFNFARVLRRLDRSVEGDQYLEVAVECDETLYRVKRAYRQEIASMSEHPNVTVIDLAELLAPDDFVDYCHPTERGHEKVATAIAGVIDLTAESGALQERSSYRCSYPSPDACFDARSSLLDYYSIDLGVPEEEISRDGHDLLMMVRQAGISDLTTDELAWPEPRSVLQHNILHAWRHAAKHPVFTHVDDLEAFAPRYGCEIGSFPEYYVYRVIWSYLKYAEARGWLTEILVDSDRARWSMCPETYRRRILSAKSVAEHNPDLSLEYCLRVIARTKSILLKSRNIFEDKRAERVITVMYWYTREAFRYGTQSRLSMLYERWELERAVEALCVCGVIARHHQRNDVFEETQKILRALGSLANVHERHAPDLIAHGYQTESDEYHKRVRDVRLDIVNSLGVVDRTSV